MTTHTREQLAIIGAAKNTTDNLLIEALAGSGKTTTLGAITPHLEGSIAIQAFNKAIADELKAKIKGFNITIGTSHSFGLKALKPLAPRARVEGGKLAFTLKDHFKKHEELIKKTGYLTRRVVSAAKNAGFGIESQFEHFPDPDNIDDWIQMCEHFNIDIEYEATGVKTPFEDWLGLCRELLAKSNSNLGMIDFDDMIYLPLFHKAQPTKYDNMLIDEAQDISPTRRELAFQSIAPTGRIIAVGDSNQAIYGFTGASADSLNEIATRASAVRFPLTICWRCDDAVLDEARLTVPDIRTAPAKVGKGTVDTVSIHDLTARLSEAQDTGEPIGNLPAVGDVILCRLNKPNVAMAMELIRRGQRVRIEGRDLGKNLIDLVKRSSSGYINNSISTLKSNLMSYIDAEVFKLTSTSRLMAAAYLADEGDCAQILLDKAATTGEDSFSAFERVVTNLFDDNIPASQFITLSSVHKSKGREWKHVWLLGRSDYMPFHRATQPWEIVQERNLIYVAITRAEQHLTYITDVQSWVDSKRNEV